LKNFAQLENWLEQLGSSSFAVSNIQAQQLGPGSPDLAINCAVLAHRVLQKRLEIRSALPSSPFQHLLIQIVHFDQPNPGGVIHTMHYRGVVTWRQRCNDCRLPWTPWSVATVPDVAHLIAGDNPADYRLQPVIVGANQSSRAAVQF